MKSRGCYETPGGKILFDAHLDLETLTLDREVMRLRDTMSIKYAELVYNGYWFAPEKEFLQVAMDHAQECVTGSVDLRLFKGNVICRGRSSGLSLYNEAMVSMDVEGGPYPPLPRHPSTRSQLLGSGGVLCAEFAAGCFWLRRFQPGNLDGLRADPVYSHQGLGCARQGHRGGRDPMNLTLGGGFRIYDIPILLRSAAETPYCTRQ